MTTVFNIDSLATRGGRFFGWGWFLSSRAPATDVRIRVETETGQHREFACQIAGHRQDLAEAYPHIPHAASGGFQVQGRLLAGDRVVSAELRVQLADGEMQTHSLAGFPDAYVVHGRMLEGGAHRLRLAKQLLRERRFGLLFRRAWGVLLRRLRRLIQSVRAGSQGHAAASVDVLILDHAMGGGANRFRDEQIRDLAAAGRTVALVVPRLATLTYELIQSGPRGQRTSRFDDFAGAVAAAGQPGEIVVNDLVSFDDPLGVVDWILAMHREHGTVVRYFLHDFFAACPSWSLIDDTGRHCGVPDVSRCLACLPRNPAPLLPLIPETSIPEWRARWQTLLSAAASIVVFSHASARLLGRAFPALPADRVEVRPHDTGYLSAMRGNISAYVGLPLTIAVIGAIGENKGASIVREMVRLIDAEQLPMRVVVVGTLDGAVDSPSLVQTGPYRLEALPATLAAHRVGVCLVPSICPETYSYVTAEIMHLGLPIAVFDLGAPAERVRGYPLGCIIEQISARQALQDIQGLAVRIGLVPELRSSNQA